MNYIVVVIAYGDGGEGSYGCRVSTIMFKTKSAADRVARKLNEKDYICEAFVVED